MDNNSYSCSSLTGLLVEAEDLSQCDVLFLSSSEPTEVKDSLDDELSRPIRLCTCLTVTDGEAPESALGLQGLETDKRDGLK